MKKVFIIPFRGREQQREVFIHHMEKILEDDNYVMLFIHQKDTRQFNRGAMKNIGFLYIKNEYPTNYKDMTFIFHDIDTMPYRKGLFDYETTSGVIQHYYGFTYALGGMFAIKGSDFEKIYGFPNYWGWGFEDNKFQKDWLAHGGKIDRTQFIKIHHPDIVQLSAGAFSLWKKTINKKNVTLMQAQKAKDSGFNTIRGLMYSTEDLSSTSKIIHVNAFYTERGEEEGVYQTGIPKRKHTDKKISRMSEILSAKRRR